MFRTAIEDTCQVRSEALISRLIWRYGQPDCHEMVGLANAAGLILRGKLAWRQAEEAIDAGWDPSAQSIADFLRGTGVADESLSEAWSKREGRYGRG